MKIKHLQILLGGAALLLLTVLFACNKDEKKKSEPQGAKIESISFKMESYSVKINETAGINLKGELKITPVSIVDTCKITWELSDPSIAKITENGVITPVKEGETIVTATVQGKSAQCKYSVKVIHVKDVIVEPAGIAENVNIGSTKKLTANIDPEDATFQTIEWKSSNTAVAIVSSDGTVTCKGEGKCTITATVDGKVGKCNVTYSPNIVHVTSVTVTPSSYSVEGRVGNTKKLTAKVLPSNATDKTVTWKSSNTAVATVSSDGTVTCKGLGTATITATADGVEGKCTAKYEPVKVTGVRIQPSTVNETVSIGATKKLTAIIEPEDATDKTVTWKSNNQAVVTVSSDGTITCKGVGEAAILVTASNNKTATCNVTYNKVPVTSVRITKAGLFFNSIGQTYKLKAEVEPSNATYKDVTWYSTNTSVATVDYNGVVTCKGFGTATITATADGHSHGCIVMSNQSYLVDPCRNMYLYKQIGNQVWMTQNMRCNIYDTQSERPNATIETYSYKNSHSATYVPYCVDASIRDNWSSSVCADKLSDLQVNTLGYLYNWEAAVGTLDYTSSFSSRRQGICPNGWHVPTDEEYRTLFNYVGKAQAAKKLRTTSGWCNGINGTDDYAFSVLPAGYASGNQIFYVGRDSYLTTATTSSQSGYTWTINFSRNSDNECEYFIESLPKNNAYGVRCIKN